MRYIFLILALIICWDQTHRVTCTVYQPVEEQTDNTPNITAWGDTINLEDPLSHRWLAVSRDLEEMGYNYGTEVNIEGTGLYDGIWTVKDRTNERLQLHVDLLIGLDDDIGKWNIILNKIT